MKIQASAFGLLTLLEFFVFSSCAASDWSHQNPEGDAPSTLYDHNRVAEIKEQCSHFLFSASELKPDDNRDCKLNTELSFHYGDWDQKDGGAELIPFDDSEMPSNNSSHATPLKLVSFEVQDVDTVQQFNNAVTLKGILSLAISKKSLFPYHLNSNPDHIRRSSAALMIVFEGVYTETEENGGERCLCMLGRSTLPPIEWYDEFSDWTKKLFGSRYNCHLNLSQVDNYLLVLRYPETVNFTKRAIQGEMRSLREQGDSQYFDKVYISSHLGRHVKYQFSSELMKAVTCDMHPYEDELMEDGVQKFNSSDVCTTLGSVSREVLSVIPNSGSSHDNVELILQQVNCEPETTHNGSGTVRVSAVLRATPARMYQPVTRVRTGLSGLTLTAEGIWNLSEGKLCMVGCQAEESGLGGCNFLISLYFPRVLSIKQRSFILGSISSVKLDSNLSHHLLFDAVTLPAYFRHNYYLYRNSYIAYKYSKIDLAYALMKETQLDKIFKLIKKSLFKYPALKDGEELLSRLSALSEDLLVNAYVIPNKSAIDRIRKIIIRIEVLSLGPLLGRYDAWSNKGSLNETAVNTKVEPTHKEKVELTHKELLNVSMHLMFKEIKDHVYAQTSYKNISELFLEGLYDQLVGEMHLIGCRNVMFGSVDTERGMDCLIDVKIQYPSQTIQWLKNPTAKITVTSQRKEADPLHFSSISLNALMTHYQEDTQVVARWKLFEGCFRILMLSAINAVILSQLLYMKVKMDATPFMSPAMLSLQVLEYGFPVISGIDILFKSKESISYDAWFYNPPNYKLFSEVFWYGENFLSLIAVILTIRLLQMVSTSRKKQVPSKSQIFLSSLAIYSSGFILWLLVYENLETSNPTVKFTPTHTWVSIVEDFAGPFQDLFLLPQILSNLSLQKHVKPLRELYYIGLTMVKLLLHMYEYIRDPILNIEFPESAFTGQKLAANFGKILVDVTMIVLVMVVHIQQSRKYQKLNLSLSRTFRLNLFTSALYKKFFAKSVED